MTKKNYVIVHGHFYQPPRENPWTGKIDIQESAAPYHDWNERVCAECYTPNSRSRVLDDHGRVLDVVNNYRYMSFNFGPTLLAYLEKHNRKTYARILDADRESVKRLGYGNAMAQVYNHVIMPLACARDRETQIQWALEDFRTRFGREAQGMWLPETGVNQDVLEDLVKARMHFVLLSPLQAQAIRALESETWEDVSSGNIPTNCPYVCHTQYGPISVLFYHASISQAVAFEHLLRNAGLLADRVTQAFNKTHENDEDNLVFVCTDGESYGHHEPMGDMCFAYFATREAPMREFIITNPAAFLAKHTPCFEVRLKQGKDGLGTTWSCVHGVSRWMEDCGCSTGGPPTWNQSWRKPMRKAFNQLRECIDPIFEREAKLYLQDPWKARNDYISLSYHKIKEHDFFQKHAKYELDKNERIRIFQLMEMQRYAMLIYTSCGWFFADISGLEGLQNLRYFVRAAQLGQLITGTRVDKVALEELKQAQSNVHGIGNGVDLLKRVVYPSVLTPPKVAVHQAILTLITPQPGADKIYQFHIHVHSSQVVHHSEFEGVSIHLQVLAERTGEGGNFEVVVLAGGELNLRAFVREYNQYKPAHIEEILDRVEHHGFEHTCAELHAVFAQEMTLVDMVQDLRLQAVETLLQSLRAKLGSFFDTLLERHENLIRVLVPFGIGLPSELATPVGYAGSHRFTQLIEQGLREDNLDKAQDLAEMLQNLGVPIQRKRASELVNKHLAAKLENIFKKPDTKSIALFHNMLECAKLMYLEIDEACLQDRLLEVLDTVLTDLSNTQMAHDLIALAEYLNLNTNKAHTRLAHIQNS